jgi:hypothetical protein
LTCLQELQIAGVNFKAFDLGGHEAARRVRKAQDNAEHILCGCGNMFGTVPEMQVTCGLSLLAAGHDVEHWPEGLGKPLQQVCGYRPGEGRDHGRVCHAG